MTAPMIADCTDRAKSGCLANKALAGGENVVKTNPRSGADYCHGKQRGSVLSLPPPRIDHLQAPLTSAPRREFNGLLDHLVEELSHFGRPKGAHCLCAHVT
jgi:hypothetical protein